MSVSDLGRIRKEISDFQRADVSGIKIELDDSDPRHFIGVIYGPSDTPYANGIYRVDINIPTDYPFSPPKMKFLTKVRM
jgi:ubiquitin-conjugating enzyme (huntingtin interacting protein 2)